MFIVKILYFYISLHLLHPHFPTLAKPTKKNKIQYSNVAKTIITIPQSSTFLKLVRLPFPVMVYGIVLPALLSYIGIITYVTTVMAIY